MTRKDNMPHVNHEDLYQVACDNFPYALDPTSITQGDYASDDGYIEYGEEFTFTAGKLFNEEIMAGGWIELRQDSGDDEPTISAIFSLSRNGDWQNGRILPETMAVQGQYDLASKTWELWIDHF